MNVDVNYVIIDDIWYYIWTYYL